MVDAAKYRSSQLRAPTVFFYCENEQHGTLQDIYILSSVIKQLCDFLRLTARPFPEDIIRAIKRFFGHKRTEPDFGDLEYIFGRLFHYVPDTIYVLDGLDALDQAYCKSLLTLFRSLFCGSQSPQESRILFLSRERLPGYVDMATFMPGIRQISTSSDVMKDIKTYIETNIADKTMYRKPTDDPLLLEEIKQVLLTESSGMYDTNSILCVKR